mmetsp:Transcript_31240/g.63367  ORF Transcript_31240/g.63367 Transcript_31240/m.63367 type:complete len:262 (-) Transcript_31240:315-1100(-)
MGRVFAGFVRCGDSSAFSAHSSGFPLGRKQRWKTKEGRSKRGWDVGAYGGGALEHSYHMAPLEFTTREDGPSGVCWRSSLEAATAVLSRFPRNLLPQALAAAGVCESAVAANHLLLRCNENEDEDEDEATTVPAAVPATTTTPTAAATATASGDQDVFYPALLKRLALAEGSSGSSGDGGGVGVGNGSGVGFRAAPLAILDLLSVRLLAATEPEPEPELELERKLGPALSSSTPPPLRWKGWVLTRADGGGRAERTTAWWS